MPSLICSKLLVRAVFAVATQIATSALAESSLGAEPHIVQEEQSRAPEIVGTPRAPGVIGEESRQVLTLFEPDTPGAFPGWRRIIPAVVRIACDGEPMGGGFVLPGGDRIVTAAHVFWEDDGTLRWGLERCVIIHSGGDRVRIREGGLKGGAFSVPLELSGAFSAPITIEDWMIVPLVRPLRGASSVPIAEPWQIVDEPLHPVLNISGPQDPLHEDTFYAQQCAYHGPPPQSAALDAEGNWYSRSEVESDRMQIARYDCDAGGGASGSPVFGWYEGEPYIWGILTDSRRGAERCDTVGYSSCYTAGPLLPDRDIVE